MHITGLCTSLEKLLTISSSLAVESIGADHLLPQTSIHTTTSLFNGNFANSINRAGSSRTSGTKSKHLTYLNKSLNGQILAINIVFLKVWNLFYS